MMVYISQLYVTLKRAFRLLWGVLEYVVKELGCSAAQWGAEPSIISDTSVQLNFLSTSLA